MGGLRLSMVDGMGLLVHTVYEGPINDWNVRWPERMVMQDDCIYEINGRTGSPSELLESLKSESRLILGVKRCETVRVQVSQGEECRGLGLGFNYIASSTTLPIISVHDGLITDWNEKHSKHPVQAGDIILTVNGICGNATQMLSKIRNESSFCLIVLRCPRGILLTDAFLLPSLLS